MPACRRLMLVVVAILVGGASPVAAQEPHQVEVTGFGGYRHGGLDEFFTGIVCIAEITTPCPSVARGRDGAVVGAVVGVAVSGGLGVELGVLRHSSALEFAAASGASGPRFDRPGNEDNDDEDVNATTVVGGIAYHWRRWPASRVTPFVSGSLGVTRLAVGRRLLEVTDTAVSGGVSGGAVVWLLGHVGTRVEIRQTWVGAPERIGGAFTVLDVTAGLTVGW